MSGLHQAVTRALRGYVGEAVEVTPDEVAEAAAAAAIGVCLAEAQRAVEALPATGRGAWLLCRTTGEVAINTKSPAAPRCPAHGGAECLAVYVQQGEALAVLAALAEEQS